MKTRHYVRSKTGYSVSQCHPTAGLVVFNDRRTFQEAVIGPDGSVAWTRPATEPYGENPLPYEEEFEEA